MALRVSSLLFRLLKTNSRCFSAGGCQQQRHASSARCTPGQWQLVSAVCLQRPAVVSADKTKLEQQFASLMAHIELEKSLLSNHELRAKEDQAVAKQQQEGKEEVATEGTRLTAFDLEDAWEAEARLFTPAGRITEADEKNDRQSVDRRLDKTLILLVKQQLGDKVHWVLPQGLHNHGESMRQTAERTLTSLCGSNVQATFLGNAPCGFFQYRFPLTANIGDGAKVFFFKALYQHGNIMPNKPAASDFLWVTKDELPEYCSRSYLRSVKKFLVDL